MNTYKVNEIVAFKYKSNHLCIGVIAYAKTNHLEDKNVTSYTLRVLDTEDTQIIEQDQIFEKLGNIKDLKEKYEDK